MVAHVEELHALLRMNSLKICLRCASHNIFALKNFARAGISLVFKRKPTLKIQRDETFT